MGYITEYCSCSLLFLIIVAVRFFVMRKFPSKRNKLFGIILWLAVFDLALDIAGAFLIDNAAVVEPWLNYAVNTVFYSIQVLFPVLMLLYVYALADRKPKHTFLLVLPALLFEVLLVLNLFVNVIFYLRETTEGLVYTRGPLFNVFFIGCFFYLMLAFYSVFVLRHSMRKTEVHSVVFFDLVIVLATILQFVFPRVLLTGVAITVAIVTMSFAIQDPSAMQDSISGVFNYGALNEYLRVQVGAGREMWLTVIDVGGIRRINSTLGLRTGNDLLESVGTFINAECGKQAIAFRMIGTRFLIITLDENVHHRIVSSVTSRFENMWKYGDEAMRLIATIRYSEKAGIFSSSEDVIGMIDNAYSQSAIIDFGTSRPIDDVIMRYAQRTSDVEEAVRRALVSRSGFSLNFQPMYSVERGCFDGAEVLLRLNDPVLGAVSPAEFIPVAEHSGLINQIDSLVLDMSCEFISSHPELETLGFKMLEVNLSAAEFYTDADGLAREILGKISGFEDRICFEVTETAATKHKDILSRFMNTLIERGVIFAIDDFGTGYANITQLASLPFSIVKLDRSFIYSGLERDRKILSCLVSMFDEIGIETVIEGVETEEQSDFASKIGVKRIQGFLYGKPLKEKDFIEFIFSHSIAVTI